MTWTFYFVPLRWCTYIKFIVFGFQPERSVYNTFLQTVSIYLTKIWPPLKTKLYRISTKLYNPSKISPEFFIKGSRDRWISLLPSLLSLLFTRIFNFVIVQKRGSYTFSCMDVPIKNSIVSSLPLLFLWTLTRHYHLPSFPRKCLFITVLLQFGPPLWVINDWDPYTSVHKGRQSWVSSVLPRILEVEKNTHSRGSKGNRGGESLMSGRDTRGLCFTMTLESQGLRTRVLTLWQGRGRI